MSFFSPRATVPGPARIPVLVSVLLLASVGPLQAQTATLRGFVTDASNGEAMPDVNVVATSTAGGFFGAATNSDGFYAVGRLAAGTYVVRASFVGYTAFVDTLRLGRGELRSLDISLVPGQGALDEVVVDAARESGAAALTAGLQTVQPADIEAVPSPDVSGDLALYLTTLPGVVSLADQGGQLFIRGGEPWHNLVLLDGMQVYQPFHILGFFSAFPVDILNSVDIYAGGYGARYGGRLSSVIDVTTRNGNNRRFAGAVTASPFILGGHVEGPLNERGSVSFLTSIRHSVVEEGASELIGEPVPYRFNDVFAKIHALHRRNGRLSLTGLHTYDRGTVGEDIGLTPLSEVRWQNDAAGVRYLYLPGSLPVLADFQISVSRLESELGPEDAPERTSSTLRINSAADMTHYGGLADVEWGLFARTLRLESDLGGAFQNPILDREYLTEVGGYIGPSFRLSPQWKVAPSLRVHAFPSKRKTFVEPRLRAVWEHGRHQVSGAFGLYHQEVVGVNDRRDATSIFTAWASVPEERVPRALHLLAGYKTRPARGLELVVEAYYKHLQNLSIAEWTSFPRLTTRLQPADGRVVGIDLRAEWRGRWYSGYVNYGLSSVRYEAQQPSLVLWYGRETFRFRPAHDRRHQVNAMATAHLSGFDLAVRWQFGSGLPFNRALGFDSFLLLNGQVNVFRDEGSRRVIYERPFNGLLPTYHRLDVSAERTFPLGPAALTLQASVINLYDRANLFYLDVFTLRRADQLPLIPSFGLKLEFP